MKLIRKAIQQIILLELKIEKSQEDLDNIKFKKYFIQNADQSSLKNLRYIHWGNPKEIMRILSANGKSEISTSIYPAKGHIEPWRMDEINIGNYTVGIQLQGFITMASNVDLNSGRHRKFHIPDNPYPLKKISFQKKTSGIPKRPNVKSLDYLTKASKHLRKMKDENRNWEDILGDPFLRAYPDHDELYGRDGKQFDDKNDILILKEDDLIPTEMDYDIEYDLLGLWPEAILDNWKPVKLWIPSELYDMDEHDLTPSILDLLDTAFHENIVISKF